MAEQFPPADVPKADNVHGVPQPPSGLHPAMEPTTSVQMIGNVDKPAPTGQPAKNHP